VSLKSLRDDGCYTLTNPDPITEKKPYEWCWRFVPDQLSSGATCNCCVENIRL